MPDLDQNHTVQATFPTRPQAETAITRLQASGVDRGAIQMRDRSGHQYPGSGRTGHEDENIASHLVRNGVKGGLLGTVIGAVVGLILAPFMFVNFSVGWWTMIIVGAVFGGGLSVLWGMMAGFGPRGAAEHGGTAARAEDVEVTVVVDLTDEPDAAPSVQEILQATGGR